MASPLENLTGPGKPLQKEPPDAKEFSGLKRSAWARFSADQSRLATAMILTPYEYGSPNSRWNAAR
jgi:hypothetical protein